MGSLSPYDGMLFICLFFQQFPLFIYVLIYLGGEREKHQFFFLFHLLMLSLVESPMCLDQGSSPHPWCIRTMV